VAAIVAYTIFAGADFGGGIWSLFAWGARKAEQRDALERAIGPVWETNHVWLILLVVTLFTAFPAAYSGIFGALYVPLFIALMGIVARGAAFAFRHYSPRDSPMSHSSLRAFAVASLITPFAFGLTIGAVTDGQLKVSGTAVTSGAFSGWLEPFAIMCGLIGLLICAFLAAAYMVPRTQGEMRRDFQRRAIAASLALGVVTTATIPVAYWDASHFFHAMSRTSVLAMMAGTAVVGLATLWVLRRGWANLAPLFAAATAGGVVLSWALAQNPYLVAPGLSLSAAAAPGYTLKAFLIALPFGALILLPSLALLYFTFSRDTFGDGS